MATILTDDGCPIAYRLDGPEGRPVVLLSNSLGTTLGMWEPQLAALTARHRVLRYDSRGHGDSGVPPGPCTMERLGRDALALLDALGLERVSFAGVSMGGMVGMWLGVHAGHRLERLVIANSAAWIGPREPWDERIATVRARGMEAIVPAVIERWFTPRFRAAEPETVERVAAMLRATPVEGYAACCAAVRDQDQREAIRGIKVPTLVVAGTHDLATPPAKAQEIAAAIEGARLVELDAAHLSNIERAEDFNRHLLGFLA